MKKRQKEIDESIFSLIKFAKGIIFNRVKNFFFKGNDVFDESGVKENKDGLLPRVKIYGKGTQIFRGASISKTIGKYKLKGKNRS